MDDKEQSTICRNCGARLQNRQRICTACGKLQQPMRRIRCRHCGTINGEPGDVCLACGSPLPKSRHHLYVPFLFLGGAFLLLALFSGRELLGLVAPAQPTGVLASATETPLASPTATASGTSTATSAPTATATETASPTPRPSATATDTASPTPTPSATATATASPTPGPSATATTTPSSTPSATPSSTSTTVPSPGPAVNPAASATPFIYTVRSGDNLYTIAQTFGVTVQAIMEANNLTSTALRVGQQLIIPLPPTTATPTPTP